jgi:hypothetical protein
LFALSNDQILGDKSERTNDEIPRKWEKAIAHQKDKFVFTECEFKKRKKKEKQRLFSNYKNKKLNRHNSNQGF